SSDVIIITPDGPRGPRYIAKPGIAAAACETGAHVVPFSWTATRFWQLGTWDKMLLPKPFSTLLVTFGDPIKTASMDPQPLQEAILQMELHANQELLNTHYPWPK